MRRNSAKTMRGLDIVGEAVHVVSTVPTAVLAGYYAGSVPFVLAFLYFWSDMSRSAFAADRCLEASLILALLFIWMKSWQTFFVSAVSSHIRGRTEAPWDLPRVLRVVLLQTIVQPFGIVLIPIAMLVTNAFFQAFSVLADGTNLDLRSALRRSWRQALLWPRQNLTVMWLVSPWILGMGIFIAFTSGWLVARANPDLQTLHGIVWFLFAAILIGLVVFPVSPFGCVVAGNIAAVIILVPGLLKSFLGVETAFVFGGMHAILNSTFIITVMGLSYLCLDPLVKAAYALRCFYGDSLRTGEDLMVELHLLDPGGVKETGGVESDQDGPGVNA